MIFFLSLREAIHLPQLSGTTTPSLELIYVKRIKHGLFVSNLERTDQIYAIGSFCLNLQTYICSYFFF